MWRIVVWPESTGFAVATLEPAPWLRISCLRRPIDGEPVNSSVKLSRSCYIDSSRDREREQACPPPLGSLPRTLRCVVPQRANAVQPPLGFSKYRECSGTRMNLTGGYQSSCHRVLEPRHVARQRPSISGHSRTTLLRGNCITRSSQRVYSSGRFNGLRGRIRVLQKSDGRRMVTGVLVRSPPREPLQLFTTSIARLAHLLPRKRHGQNDRKQAIRLSWSMQPQACSQRMWPGSVEVPKALVGDGD